MKSRLGVDSTDFREMLLPVRRVDRIAAHALARGGRVHELAASDVDADVAVLLSFLVEEQQIARLQARGADLARRPALLLGAARQADARLAEAELDQAAAIEAGGVAAAVLIRLAHHACRGLRGAVDRTALVDLGARGSPGLVGAAHGG